MKVNLRPKERVAFRSDSGQPRAFSTAARPWTSAPKRLTVLASEVSRRPRERTAGRTGPASPDAHGGDVSCYGQSAISHHHLHLLSSPARVGPPPHNFLSWNGTELICRGGHGLLHVPELQMSWMATQTWQELDPSWQALFPK